MLKITQLIVDNANNTQSKIPAIVFFGDSVTKGCFETVPDAGNNPRDREDVYHNLLKNLVKNRYPGVDLKIINAGLEGNSAPAALKRIDQDVLSKKPDFCVVCFGLNDTFGGKSGLKRYATALGKIFDRLSNAGCETVFMTPNMMNTYVSPKMEKDIYYLIAKKTASYQTRGRMDAYMDMARETAAAHGVPVCDCYARWKELAANGFDVTDHLANYINHPSREMHHLFAKELYKLICPE